MIERYIYIQRATDEVGIPLVAEVVNTEQEIGLGLMYRRVLPENRGMLFVFQEEQQLSFWMQNTYLPLSIAYLDADGAILEIYDAKPLDETSIVSESHRCMFALEVNQGWFEKHNVGVGARVLI